MEKLDDDDDDSYVSKISYDNIIADNTDSNNENDKTNNSLVYSTTTMGDDEEDKDTYNEYNMILNNVTSLTQDSEDDDEIESILTKPASIISQPNNKIIFHRESKPQDNKNVTFSSIIADDPYKKPSMIPSNKNVK